MLRVANTENGKVLGEIGNDPRVTVFKGIPYAAPPVGDLRWRAPRPAANWSGVREATTFASMAIQGKQGVDMDDFYTKEVHPASGDYTMDEDCLYLNVWTPAKTASECLPVYLWIHGGGYRGGYSYEMLIDGERLARRDVVFVSIAYRLNIFGFFAHPDMLDSGDLEGNYGILDQFAAIQWVKRNIAAFGGDPDRITIGGQSAGAGSVMAHVTSPMARHLFAGAIVQSGGGLRSIGYQQPARTLETAAVSGKKFLDSISAKSLAEARAIPAAELFCAFENYGGLQVSPVIDGKYLTEDPTDAVIHGRYAKIPYLIGYNEGEGQGSPAAEPFPESADIFRDRLKERYGDKVFEALADIRTMEDVKNAVKSPAFNSRTIATLLYCQIHARQGGTAYAYCCGHDMPGDNMGAYHGAELWFVFESLSRCWRPFSGKHYDLARQMCNYWMNFVKNGDPNGLDADGCAMPQWERFGADDPKCMLFTDQAKCAAPVTDPLTVFILQRHLDAIPPRPAPNPCDTVRGLSRAPL
jgi:para-nitrobenzyl esterase